MMDCTMSKNFKQNYVVELPMAVFAYT
jgi:hypothetical protein